MVVLTTVVALLAIRRCLLVVMSLLRLRTRPLLSGPAMIEGGGLFIRPESRSMSFQVNGVVDILVETS